MGIAYTWHWHVVFKETISVHDDKVFGYGLNMDTDNIPEPYFDDAKQLYI